MANDKIREKEGTHRKVGRLQPISYGGGAIVGEDDLPLHKR